MAALKTPGLTAMPRTRAIPPPSRPQPMIRATAPPTAATPLRPIATQSSAQPSAGCESPTE